MRQPIVCVMGHVDHGKTSILDRIRSRDIVSKESGGITQHIGATEVPLQDILERTSAGLAEHIKVPGLLFIDTPGHHSFMALRSRGGALTDLAVLVIDINEGFKPQTLESLNILRRERTPFIIAANKVDRVPGWNEGKERGFLQALKAQDQRTQDKVNERLYELVGELDEHGLPADRYDRISDFTETLGIVPCSAKTGAGIPDLLMVLIGLAQRYLEDHLTEKEGPAEGTILEVEEIKGLGTTLNVILYQGTLEKGSEIAFTTAQGPVRTHVKAILKPRPLEEIRHAGDRFERVDEAVSACGIKLSAPGLEDAVAGGRIRALQGKDDEEGLDIVGGGNLEIDLDDHGVVVKADVLGSLEAMVSELKVARIPVRAAGIGPVSRREAVESRSNEALDSVLIAFNVPLLPEARDEIEKGGVQLFEGDIIYRLLEDLEAWRSAEMTRAAEEKRSDIPHPTRIRILKDHTFRATKPAIVGVHIEAGQLRTGMRMLNAEGRVLGRVRSIRDGEEVKTSADQGTRVAVAIEGITIGRQIDEEEAMWSDLNGLQAKELREGGALTRDEQQVLQEITDMKRKTEKLWGF